MENRPRLNFLSKKLIEQIIEQARDVLCSLGVQIFNPDLISLLADHGARILKEDTQVYFSQQMIDLALSRAPRSFQLFNVQGIQTHDFRGDQVYFTPGSSALEILDINSKKSRRAATVDYIRYAKIVQQLSLIHSQSTAFVPADVLKNIRQLPAV
jgi:trimethylamine--corrinoid protein Co-methyltransferase